MLEHRAHRVHLRMAGRRITALGVDRFEHRAGSRQRQARPAIFFRDQRTEKAAFGQRLHELKRIGVFAVELEPICVVKVLAQTAHCIADVGPCGLGRHGNHIGVIVGHLGILHITLRARRSAISRTDKPASAKIASECSPASGAET